MRAALLLLLVSAASSFGQLMNTPAAGKFPALRIQALVGTQQRLAENSFYQKTMQVKPKVIVEGTSRMTPIPPGELTMLVITMDTHAKYTQHKEVCKVCSSETLPLPEAPNGERREFNFADSSLIFDAWRDTSNVGGEVYKWFLFGLRDPETKTLVAFETNNQQLDNFCKAHPEKRQEFLSLAKGAPFPTDFK